MICYITSQTAITDFFNKIHNVPKPSEYSKEWSISIGLKDDSNLSRFTRLLQEMGFIDEEYKPTIIWDKFRADFNDGLNLGVRNAYSELFTLLGNPFDLEREKEVKKWFKRKMSDKNNATVDFAISTFNILCSLVGSFKNEVDDIYIKKILTKAIEKTRIRRKIKEEFLISQSIFK